jgi:hypothetical protein
VGRTSPSFRYPDIKTPFLQERFHCRDQVDVLDARDKAGCSPLKERDGFFQHRYVEVHLVRQEDDPVPFIDRCMADMDEYIGMVKRIECKVAGTVAGIAADDDVKPGGPQGTGIIIRTPFQAGRELEGDIPCPPFPQLPDKVRGIV